MCLEVSAMYEKFDRGVAEFQGSQVNSRRSKAAASSSGRYAENSISSRRPLAPIQEPDLGSMEHLMSLRSRKVYRHGIHPLMLGAEKCTPCVE